MKKTSPRKIIMQSGSTYIEHLEIHNNYYTSHSEEPIKEEQKSKQQPIHVKKSDEEVRRIIETYIPKIKIQNLWYAIVKPLMMLEYIKKSDYEAAKVYLEHLFPEGVPTPFKAADLRRMDVFSLSKDIDYWVEESANIHGKRFQDMQGLASDFYADLKNP